MGGPSSAEIRAAFLRFFAERGHRPVASSSLVPADDPTLLFTNAGMNQFKDVFTGRSRLDFTRATSAQKCVRAGGKHNDLENVGRTPRHHTFFEMLGNFSFGDYFKEAAITYAWDFLVKTLGLDPARLWVTIYRDDDEAFALWRRITDLPAERIVRLGDKDNFWAMGDTGPCGPSSEVLYDRGAEHRCTAANCGIGLCDCARWLEIWNLVFMQFDRDRQGTLAPLPSPSIDTGMGLERMASILQGVPSNFDVDVFTPILATIAELSGKPYPGTSADPRLDEAGFPFRVIADHARACCFLIADGVLPSNEGRGYVLRRILRRAVRFGRRLGLEEPFLWRLRAVVAAPLAGTYPELDEQATAIEGAIRTEEERFAQTLADGLAILEREATQTRAGGGRQISGDVAFRLHDTYGFPLDLTLDVATEQGLSVDVPGFERALEGQRQRARADRRARQVTYGGGMDLEGLPPTTFLGYDTTRAEGEVLALAGPDGQRLEVAGPGAEVTVVLDRTPFYAEGGGEVADTGVITAAVAEGGARLEVLGVRRLGQQAIAHTGRVVAGELRPGAVVTAEVDAGRRRDIARNHSATHLLHRALREVLGSGVHQAGSLVGPDRLRFDFTYGQPITAAELAAVQDLVNAQVLDPVAVEWFVTGLDEARQMGAMALFGEKYGQRVRVVRMGAWSLELCGGLHVASTAEVGLFHLGAESGIGSGVRRIEAVTGRGVLAVLSQQDEVLSATAGALRTRVEEVGVRAAEVVARLAETTRELTAARRQQVLAAGRGLVAAAAELEAKGGPFKVASGVVAAADMEELRALADDLRARLGSGAVVLAADSGNRGVLLCALTPDLVSRGLHAGRVVAAAAAAAGGRGGGRPDLAHAGVPEGGRSAEALAAGVAALAAQAAG